MPDNELMLKVKGDASGAKTELASLGKALGGSKTAMGGLVQGIATGAVAIEAARFLAGTIERAKDMQAESAKLQVSIRDSGGDFTTYAGGIKIAETAAISMGYTDDQMTAALSNLTTMTGSASKAMNDYGLVMDLARFRNIDLASAAAMVSKVEEGKLGVVIRTLPFLKSTMTAEEALAALREHVAGQAEAYSKTGAGAADMLNARYDELQETIGFRLLPIATKFVTVLSDLVGWFSSLSDSQQSSIIDTALWIGGIGLGTLAIVKLSGAIQLLGVTQLGSAVFANMGAGIALVAQNATMGIGALAGLGATAVIAEAGLVGLAAGAGLLIGNLMSEFIPGLKQGQQQAGEFIASLKPLSQYQQEANTAMGASADVQANLAKYYDATTGKLNAQGEAWVAETARLNKNTAAQHAVQLAVHGTIAAKARAAATADDAAEAEDGWTRAMNGAKVAADTLAGTERSLVELDLASRTAKWDVKDAQDALTKARKEKGKGAAEDVARAEIALTTAQLKAKDSARDLADAQVKAGVKIDGTKGKVTDYGKQLDLIPGDITTTVNAHLNDQALHAWIAKIVKLDPGMGAIMAKMYPRHAEGGYFDKAHIGIVCDEPEWVINPKKPNARALVEGAARDVAGGGVGFGTTEVNVTTSVVQYIARDVDITTAAKEIAFQQTVALRAAGVIA